MSVYERTCDCCGDTVKTNNSTPNGEYLCIGCQKAIDKNEQIRKLESDLTAANSRIKELEGEVAQWQSCDIEQYYKQKVGDLDAGIKAAVAYFVDYLKLYPDWEKAESYDRGFCAAISAVPKIIYDKTGIPKGE